MHPARIVHPSSRASARRPVAALAATAAMVAGLAFGATPAAAQTSVVPAPGPDAVLLPGVTGTEPERVVTVDPAFQLPTQYSVVAECNEIVPFPVVTLTPVANAGYPDAAGENYLGYLEIVVNGVVRAADDVSGVLGQPTEFWTEGATLYDGDTVEMYLTAGGKEVTASTTVACHIAPSIPRYVVRVYQDLFQRLPDDAGFADWVSRLQKGQPRIDVSNAITGSTEFRTVLLQTVYQRFLGRQADPVGLSTWLAELAKGRTISQVEAGFIASDEYWAQGGSTAAGWVELLYADVLWREPSAQEVDYWVNRLKSGASRFEISMGFLLSTENLTTEVNGYYNVLLSRDIDPAGRASWVQRLQAGGRDEAIIGGILASAEYYERR